MSADDDGEDLVEGAVEAAPPRQLVVGPDASPAELEALSPSSS